MLAKKSALSVAALVVPYRLPTTAVEQARCITGRTSTPEDIGACKSLSSNRAAPMLTGYGGAASSGQSTNEPLFIACMNASGWSLEKPGTLTEAAAAGKAQTERGRAQLR